MRVIIALLLFAIQLQAANHYVLREAAGTRDGSDWVNAFTNLPTSLTRGDTYYIGDGIYTAANLNDAVSGTSIITVQKATSASHGTDTGWSSSFGDGQAVFTNTFVIAKPNYVVDGAAGGGAGSWTNGFGFFMDGRANTSSGVLLLASGCTNIIVRHFEVLGAGADGTGNSCDGINQGYVTNVFMSDWYVRNMGRTIVFSRGQSIVFSNFYSGYYESTAGEHSEFASIQPDYADPVTNVTFINGFITHMEGTGGILGTYDSLKVVNVIFDPDGSSDLNGNGYIATWTDSQMTRARVYNCTFFGGSTLVFTFGALTASGNAFSNNLVMSAYISPWSLNAFSHDYNAYGSIAGDFTDTYAEAHCQTNVQTSIFSSYASHDFRLATHTDAGIVTPYTTDIVGTTRTFRDRGAYEFVPTAGVVLNVTGTANVNRVNYVPAQ